MCAFAYFVFGLSWTVRWSAARRANRNARLMHIVSMLKTRSVLFHGKRRDLPLATLHTSIHIGRGTLEPHFTTPPRQARVVDCQMHLEAYALHRQSELLHRRAIFIELGWRPWPPTCNATAKEVMPDG
ncbi:hypothetical protein EV401DRAFT_1939995, partial [Pisolithus croceorrhizus]